ncbi:phage distal tail protein, Rcc01695 family [Pseudooceanicola sp. C21-150M6]|uniref:phage distal tail protein, Rcc01695 family n=1 Tax=Pseudooceanicola sp. C21-150M6 TaxID=3434355 RepID=UPI003D7FBD60
MFHEVRFPPALSRGSSGGPERRTEIVTLANGYEERNAPWSQSRRRYDAGVAMRSMDDIEALIAFFEARQGQLYGFRWKDWADYRSCAPSGVISETDQVVGLGDGDSLTFGLAKNYRSGAYVHRREVTKPVAATVKVAVGGDLLSEGVDYTLDLTTGLIVLVSAPPAGMEVTAGFEFDVPVRFDTDRIAVSVASFQAGDVPSVPVVEVRV